VSQASTLRILVLHSRYLSGDASGENRVVQDETKLLSEGGHLVRVWQPAPERSAGLGLLATGIGAVWSRTAAAEVRRIMQEFGPDVVHCHNLLPSFSPAVIRVAHSEGSAVVMTLHNYRLMCLPSTFLRDGHVCEDCLGHVPWRGVIYRCYRDSALGSAALATSLSLHRMLHTFDRITLFVAVSKFVRDKYIEAGFPSDRVRVKSNFAWPAARREGPGDYFLFLGRLSPEKGVRTLLEAWKRAPGRVLVIGGGPEADTLRALAPRNVEFGGSVPASRVSELLQGARALLLPSLSYEAQPRVILEAYAASVPVLASRIGGLSDFIVEGQSGLLLSPYDPLDWIRAAERLVDDDESTRLGYGAYRLWEQRFHPERGLRELEKAYRDALSRR